MPLRRRRLAQTFAFMAACAVLCVALTPSGIPPATASYRALREAHPTALLDPGPAPPPSERPPPTALRYPSEGRSLKLWRSLPEGPGPHPTVIYLHGGAALEAAEWQAAQALVEAGYAVVAPTWRGEGDNEGAYELCLGEVDDAIAAVRWAAAQPELDGERLFSFGYQTGGVISGMLSLHALPLLATASASALYREDALDDLGVPLPFADTSRQRTLRVLPPFLGQPLRPHIAYVGAHDPLIAPERRRLEAAAERGGLRVNLFWLDADHRGALPLAIEAFIAQID